MSTVELNRAAPSMGNIRLVVATLKLLNKRTSTMGCLGGLLVVTHGQFGGDGFEVAKETACAVVAAGGEIEFGGARRASGVVTAGGGAVAGAESPEAADGERLSGCLLDEADELTSGEITGGNGAATIRASGSGELAIALYPRRLLPYWLELDVYLRRINSCTRPLASRPPALMSVLEKTNPGPRLLDG
jgi:hypothetical protein